MVGRGQETHLKVWERLVGSPVVREGSGVRPGSTRRVWRPTRRSRAFWQPPQRSGRGREAHPEVREGSGGHPSGPDGDERPTQRAGRGWKSLPDNRVWSVVPPEGREVWEESGPPEWLGEVRSSRESLLEGLERSGGPPSGPKVSGGPPTGLEGPLEVQEWSGGPPGGSGGVGRPT